MSEGRDVGKTQRAMAGFEDGGRDHEPRNVGPSWPWKRQENEFFPRASREEHAAAHIMTLAQRPILDFWPPEFMIE